MIDLRADYVITCKFNANKTINRAGTIDGAYYEIAAAGSLFIVGNGNNIDCEVCIFRK